MREQTVSAPTVSGTVTLQQYRTMMRIRAFEEAAGQGLDDGIVYGAIHPYIGEEAIATGVCEHLRRDDIVLSTHRGHGHTIAKGADPRNMMAEIFGRETGNCHGKGGSMHVADFGVGMLGANGVVAANIVIAAGAAHAIKMSGDDRVVACFFGDGATNRGPFLEGLNWAAVYELPVLFVCEDNQWSATTATPALTAGGGPSVRAAALGLIVRTVDGNDVGEVSAVAQELIDQMRRDPRPAFLHARTYRLTGHTRVDAAAYRDAAEVERAWTVEPIARCRAQLLTEGTSEQDLAEVDAQVAAEIKEAVAFALASPTPDPREAYTDVQDAGTPQEMAF